MNIYVGKWGNSLGLRIPGAVAKELGLHNGSELDLQTISGTLVLRPVPTPDANLSLDDLLAAITPETIHEETDWGDPQGREHW